MTASVSFGKKRKIDDEDEEKKEEADTSLETKSKRSCTMVHRSDESEDFSQVVKVVSQKALKISLLAQHAIIAHAKSPKTLIYL